MSFPASIFRRKPRVPGRLLGGLVAVILSGCAHVAAPSGDYVAAGDVTTPPVFIGRPDPVDNSPLDVWRASGTATVRFVVEKDGTVREATVLRATSAGIGRAVVQAVLQSAYRPGALEGRPVRTLMTATIGYSKTALRGEGLLSEGPVYSQPSTPNPRL